MKSYSYLLIMCVIALLISCRSNKYIGKQQPNDLTDLSQTLRADSIANASYNIAFVGSLKPADPHIYLNLPDTSYRTPFDVYLLDVNSYTDSIRIDLTSIGNMFGFKKSIMYPVVALLDENGRKTEGRVRRYEIMPADQEAVSLKSEWSFGIHGPGKYYFVVMADMSGDALARMNLYTKEQAYALGAGMGALIMNYPVYRSAFAKYYFKYYY